LAKVQGRYLSIADPAHAPAGDYAKQALTSLGFWKKVSPWTVRAQNVTAALFLVEREEAPFGIVYKTDVRGRKLIVVLATFPEHTHLPILYELAMVANQNSVATRHFYEFLNSPAGNKTFRRFGFLSP
jgi:molybdate transport system substrate-binding protein